MKSSDLKVVAIILAIALFFTIVTSNAVSIASVVLLAKGDNGSTIVDGNNGNNGNNGGNNNSTPADNNGNNSTPADNNGGDSNTPADNNSGNGGSSNTPADNNSGNGGGSNAPAGNNSGNGGGTNSNEWDKTKTFNFYKAACDKITSTGAAGHTRKEWQEIAALNLGSASSMLKPIIQSFMKTEDQAKEAVSDKGSDDAKRRMAPCGADISYVKSATKKDLSNGNYQITIVMNDENTPKKGSKGVAAMATGILYMEDVQETVKNDSTVSKVVKSLDKAEIIYQAYTIVAEMTKDGKFVSIEHHTDGAISASAKLSIGSMNGTGTLAFYSKWYNFKY